MEVTEQLAGMIDVQRLADFLGLDENLNIALFNDGIVDLLAFLGAHIARVLRHNLRRIEYIVAQHGMDKRHDQSRFGSLFGSDGRGLLADFC